MRAPRLIALLTALAGLAAAAAVVVYAGAPAVGTALAALQVSGLLILMVAHLPAVMLMGSAWWLASGAEPPATLGRFVWSRAVRDAAAETLPFLQVGGLVLGVRSLGAGRAVAVRGAVAAMIDGLIELFAKLPYGLAALAALLALAPHSELERPLLAALALSAALTVLAAVPLLARGGLGRIWEAAVRAASRRLPAMLAPRSGRAAVAGEEGSLGEQISASATDMLRARGRLWLAAGLHLLCWFVGAAEVWLAMHLLGQDVSWPQALALDGVVSVLRTFGVLVPAAVGVQEASYLLAAQVLGIPDHAAVAAALARRGRDLALGLAVLGLAAVSGALSVALSGTNGALAPLAAQGPPGHGPRWVLRGKKDALAALRVRIVAIRASMCLVLGRRCRPAVRVRR